jgi:hypothetical protein
MSDSNTLNDVTIFVGEAAAIVVVLANQTAGRKFASFGVDVEGAFLETESAERIHLSRSNLANALLATEKDQIFVREMALHPSNPALDAEVTDETYEIKFHEAEPQIGMGAP